jgi:hypothetical protein
MAPTRTAGYLGAVMFSIAYFGPSDRRPDFEEVDAEIDDLAAAKAQAARDVAPGGPYEWAQSYQIRDWSIFDRDSEVCDPMVASWQRPTNA